jgi:hypothetical protein
VLAKSLAPAVEAGDAAGFDGSTAGLVAAVAAMRGAVG